MWAGREEECPGKADPEATLGSKRREWWSGKRIRTKTWPCDLATWQSLESSQRSYWWPVRAEGLASAVSREVILEIWGCWGTERWGYSRGYERRGIFHVYFLCILEWLRREGELLRQQKGERGYPKEWSPWGSHPAGGRDRHLLRWEISNSSSCAKEGS